MGIRWVMVWLCAASSLLGALSEARAQERVCYQLPFSTSTITSPYGAPRSYGSHRGVDFGRSPAVNGAAIPAIADGVVVINTWNSCLGNVVVVRHPDGMHSGYSHMLGRSPLGVDTRVRRGQEVGRIGNTGSCSQGAHLHLTLGAAASSYNSSPVVNPIPYIQARLPDANGSCGCEGEACATTWLHSHVGAYAPARTTDINGDGRADVCGRGGVGLWCHLSNGAGFELEPKTAVIPLDAARWKEPRHHATLRMGDVDGDGLADVCGRDVDGVKCWASQGDGAWEAFDGPALSDAAGWGRPEYYTTLRMADINGDGRADLCARDADGLACWPSVGRGFGELIRGPAWSDASGFAQSARFYGTLRMGDISGDRRDDACIRHSSAFVCAVSNGQGFEAPVEVAQWGDAQGWGNIRFWATIRLLDLDGDGSQDVCARTSTELRCVLSRGGVFAETVTVAALSDASGWDDEDNWSTLRAGDIDGDGADEVCARANAGMRCWRWGGAAAVEQVVGPDWSDDRSWDLAPKYGTIRMGDVDGDGRADLCSKADAGWTCYLADDAGFRAEPTTLLEEFKTGSGWGEAQYWSTLQLAGPRCSPERCNGRDDDCDGQIDEETDAAGQACDVGDPDPCITGQTACVSGQVLCQPIRSTRAECAPDDMGALGDMGAPGDMGGDLGGAGADMRGEDMDGARPSVEAEGDVGCACGVAPRGGDGALSLFALGLCVAAARRHRARRATGRPA